MTTLTAKIREKFSLDDVGAPKMQTNFDAALGLSLLCFLQGPSGWTMSTARGGRPHSRPAPPTAGASPTASTQKMWVWCAVTKGFLVSNSTIRWSTT